MTVQTERTNIEEEVKAFKLCTDFRLRFSRHK